MSEGPFKTLIGELTPPMRLMMKALSPASALIFSVNQNPIRRYEARPTPSHPTNINR